MIENILILLSLKRVIDMQYQDYCIIFEWGPPQMPGDIHCYMCFGTDG